jgi:hypothetical protein
MTDIVTIQRELQRVENEARALAQQLTPYLPADPSRDDLTVEAQNRAYGAAAELMRARRALNAAVKEAIG